MNSIYKYLHLVTLCSILFISCTQENPSSFVKVDGTSFTQNGEAFEYVGTNFWYGPYLGQPGEDGNRDRLNKELDFLAEHGITNLRILGSSEEAVFENSLSPTFINADGSYNESLLIGLDYLLAEMDKRDMHAVIFLNNYWEWSGGMSSYHSWYGGGIPVDPSTGNWDGFMKFSAEFYQNEQAQNAFRNYIEQLVTRTNSMNGISYIEDPTIMSWQLANEPRPGTGEMSPVAIQAYYDWIEGTADFIKTLDPNHLVSSGSEGERGSLDSMEIFIEAHNTPNIDYLTFHMWAKNWSWIDPANMAETFSSAQENANNYVLSHIEIAEQLNKPLVMEEFGFPRDAEEYSTSSPTTFRDQYYKMVFDLVEEHNVLAGTNFWSWGGFGQAQNENYWWVEGDPFMGDPPQEPQGLNSVFATDSSTLSIIVDHAKRIGALE
ncbi:MAG: beta-mannosidase [Balneolaceae bacterium]